MKKILILLITFLTLSLPCFASSWYWIGVSHDGSQCYIDNSSVQKNSNYAVIWLKIIKPDGSNSIEKVGVSHYRRAISLLEYFDYDTEGNVVKSGTIANPQWITVPPDSVGDAIFDAVY